MANRSYMTTNVDVILRIKQARISFIRSESEISILQDLARLYRENDCFETRRDLNEAGRFSFFSKSSEEFTNFRKCKSFIAVFVSALLKSIWYSRELNAETLTSTRTRACATVYLMWSHTILAYDFLDSHKWAS